MAPNPVPPSARIRYAKTTLPGAVNQNFTISASNGLPQTTINATTGYSAYHTLGNLGATTTFTEQAVAGWRGARVTCVADTGNNGVVRGSVVYVNQTPAPAGSAFTSVVPANTFVGANDYTCTFTNDRTQVRFAKVTRPANFNLNFTVTGTNGIGALTINAAGQPSGYQAIANVAAITTLTETATPRWRGMNITCIADTGINGEVAGRAYLISGVTGAFNSNYVATIPANRLLAGNDYTCTITNEHEVRIRYAKVTQPENINQNFTINAVNGLPATAINATTGPSAYRTLTNPAASTIFVELAVPGWRGMSMACIADTGLGGVGQGSQVFSNATRGTGGTNYSSIVAANTFVPGNDYTCTFTNARTRIRLAKETVTPEIDQNFTVNSTTSNGIGRTIINAAGSASNYLPLTNVMAATTLSEAALAGWRGVGLSCLAETAVNGEVQNDTVFSSVTLGEIGAAYSHALPANSFTDGNDYICTFTNEAVRIRYSKETLPPDFDQNFTMNAVNGLPQTVINATAGFSAYRVLSNPASNTSFVEAAAPGWRGVRLSCIAESGNNGVTEGSEVFLNSTPSTAGAIFTSAAPAETFVPGNDYTCTVTNDRTRISLLKATRTPFIDQNFIVNATPNNGVSSTIINAVGNATAYIPLTDVVAPTILTENAVTGWRGAGITCVADTDIDGQTPNIRVFSDTTLGDLSAAYTVTIPANTFRGGNDYTCTITNETTRIGYDKQTHPADIDQDFIISAVNGLPQTTINATDGPTPYRVLHNPGIDTIFTERAVAAWQPLRLECVADSGNNGVTSGAIAFPMTPTAPGVAGQAYSWTVPADRFVIGNDYTCTFVNARTRLRLAKVTQGGTGRFTFNGTAANSNGFPTNSSYTVVTTAPDTPAYGPFVPLSKAETLTEIAETVPLGWTLMQARCEDMNAGETGNLPLPMIGYVNDGRKLIIPAEHVKPGADLVCTFTDRLTGFTVSGQVLLDDGASGGDAHDGIQNGGETGLGSVLLRLTNCGTVTYGSAMSNGAGNFSISLADVPDNSQVCLVRDTVASHIGVSGQVGTTGGTLSAPGYNMLRFTKRGGINYTGVVFGLIATPRFGIDNTATMTPDDAVIMEHRYTATTVADVAFSGIASGEPSSSLFTVQLYHDENCSGSIEEAEGLISGNIPVTPGLVVCILVRVQSSVITPPGARLRYELSAHTPLSGTQATLAPLSNTDIVLVTDGAVRVLKRVRNVTLGGAFSTTAGSTPGDILEYQVIFLNPSASPIHDVRVLDMTPEYTSLSEAIRVERQPSGLSCEPEQPAGGGSAGYQGDLRWRCTGSMPPGDEGEVRFRVQVAD